MRKIGDITSSKFKQKTKKDFVSTTISSPLKMTSHVSSPVYPIKNVSNNT